MSQVIITSSTLILNGQLIKDLIAGDSLELAFLNDDTAHIESTDGGVTISKRIDANVGTLTVRVQRNSEGDVFLNNAINSIEVTVIEGTLTQTYKTISGEGIQILGVSTYRMTTGTVIGKPTVTINNQDGNDTMEYLIRFRNIVRSI